MNESMSLHKAGELRLTVEACILTNDKILLQKRSNDSDQFPGFWTLPGGHVDKGESLITAAARELLEETGVDLEIAQFHLAVNTINHHIDTNKIWIATAFKAVIDEELKLTGTDEGDVEWVEQSSIKNLQIFPPIKHYMDFLIQEKDKTMFMTAEVENMEITKIIEESIVGS